MEREYIFRCKVCNKQLVSAPKIQVCGCSNRMEVCDNKITANDLDKIEMINAYPRKQKKNVLSDNYLLWQESRKRRKIKKLDFEIR